MNAPEIAARLAQNILALVQTLLPNGRKLGSEWQVGSLGGEAGKSCCVHLTGEKAGVWCEFNGGAEKGDALDLVKAVYRYDTAAALVWAHRWLGIDDAKPKKPQWQRVAEYLYTDENEQTLFRVIRLERLEDGKVKKKFPQESFKDGAWHKGEDCMQGVRRVLYHLPKLIAARRHAANGRPPRVFICEGEKDANHVASAEFLATTSPGGAGKWRAEYNQYFAGFDVVVCEDKDEEGRKHAETVAANVFLVATSVRVITFRDLPEGADVSNWINNGGTPETLTAMVEQTPLWAPPQRPQITVVPGERHLAADAGLNALKLAGTPFYQRGGVMVRVSRLRARAYDKTEIRPPGIVPVTRPMLERALGRAATWEVSKYGKYQPDDPPSAVAEQIMGMTDEWHFPALAGVIACPTLRPDGTLLDADGYDAKTGLVLYQTVKVPPLKDKPSKAEAREALELLQGLLEEFPFAKDDGISKSIAISMLMTPVLRGAMEAAPMHLFIAPQPGTGKSYLADLASLIATGERAAAFAVSVKPEETEKRLNGHVLAGFLVILMDNCGELIDQDPTLCQVIERPRLSVRRLGASEPVMIDNTSTIFANGNNTSVVDDLVRRTLRGTLDANTEEPETRPFKLNPARMIGTNRGQYIAAILTIARAYIASNEKPPAPLLSFEGWSRFVRAPLVWLDCADPVKSIEQLRKADPVRSARALVFTAWRDAIGFQNGVTAPTLIQIANETPSDKDGKLNFSYAHPELRDALLQVASKAGNADVIEPRRLGKWLPRQEGTISSGIKLTSDRHDERRPLYSLSQVIS
jgi:putative DNA primase/helicase